MSQPSYPLLLAPLLVQRIWGADRLPSLHGLSADAPAGERAPVPIGESWLLCDDNLVRNGPLAGRRVVDVIDVLGGRLLGSANLAAYGTKLALMAKFLDAAADLSIQVHPDDAYALEHEAATGHLGKAEAWYVLDAAPGAGVVWGFQRQVTASEVRAAVADGTLEGYLNRVPVARGDVIVNPAGTVHAVGAGLLLFEIQQSSDLTYRLYDYGRRDADGRLRELHLNKALAVADLQRADLSALSGRPAAAPATPGAGGEPGWRLLVDAPQFTLESASVGGGALNCATSARSFDLLVAVTGSVAVEPPLGTDATFAKETLSVGDAALLPADLGAYRLSGAGEVLRSRVAGTGQDGRRAPAPVP